MNRRSKYILPIVLGCISFSTIHAQEPAWILVEKGRAAYEERDLFSAMDFLLEAVEEEPEYPEAEYWLGKVFEAQGQPDLAEEQFRRAINLAIYLRVPAEAVAYRYALAESLLRGEEDSEREAEAILASIAADEAPSVEEEIAMGHRYVSVVAGEGLDELLYLYRDERRESLKAIRMLGEKAWIDGRHRTALLESTRAILSMLSTAARIVREGSPEWRFDIDPVEDALNPDRDVRYRGPVDGVGELLGRIARENRDLSAWMDREAFWPQLYLLSVSLYANGYEDAARDLWGLMAEIDAVTGIAEPRPEAGQWGRLAVRQLESPFISVGALAP